MIKTDNKKKRWLNSPRKQKILLLLAAGVSLGMTRSYKTQRRIIRVFPKAWKQIDKQYLYKAIAEFKNDRLIDYRENGDGTTSIIITELGQKQLLRMDLDNIKVKSANKWDGFWRVVFFDVPEKKRQIRDALRDKLRQLDFYEFQHSVFIHPYPCEDEINFIAEVLDARPYVAYGEIKTLFPDAKLRLHFKLPPN